MARTARGVRAPVLLLLAILSASLLASFQALGLVNSAPLYPDSAGAEGASVTPRTPMLLIVIDGLGEDTARSLRSLQQIAERGASARVFAEVPTFSAAAYVSLLSGVSPLSSGRRTNARLFAARVDSIPDRLSRGGRIARALSDEVGWWGTLFPRGFSQVEVVPTNEIVARAEQWMGQTDLLVVHLCAVDEAGHSEGALSSAYRRAAADADELIAALMQRWGDRGVVSVISDHGHVPAGGHGGPEDDVRRTWWVAAGPGVAPHSTAALRAVDVAPTLAAWLGVPSPAQAEGRTAIELVDAPASELQRLRDQDTQRLAALERVRGAALHELVTQRDHARLVRGVVLLVLTLATLWCFRGTLGALGWGAVSSAVALSTAGGLFFSLWGPPSFSSASAPGFIALRCVLLFLVSAIAIVPWSVRRQADPERQSSVLLGAALVSALPAATVFVLEGGFAERAVVSDPVLAVLPLHLWPVAGAGALFSLLALAVLRLRPRAR